MLIFLFRAHYCDNYIWLQTLLIWFQLCFLCDWCRFSSWFLCVFIN